jgi:glucose/arabinose dehydrogenase
MVGCNDSQARPSGAAEASAGSAEGQPRSAMRLERLAAEFNKPVYLTAPAGDPRLFIVEQAGRIRIVKNGSAVRTPFLDISDRVRSGGEQGLLSMAFHPAYRTNGYFYVNFTDRQGDTRIERFKVSANPDVADAQSAKLILGFDQPYSNHNGGHLQFGPDGMLWIGTGDGGSGGDPRGNGQNTSALLGKMLRIDVDRGDPYGIPANNPFASGSGGAREVWAYGLRNPWRFAFDRSAGLLYIADVGQNEQEEVHVEPFARARLNYGWNTMEGDRCYRRDGCDRSGLQIPQVTYGHLGNQCSITGGYVYRGRRVPALAGHYFYSDYCAGWLKSFRFVNGRVTDSREWAIENIGHVVSFGEDSFGELYIVAEGGGIYRLAGS